MENFQSFRADALKALTDDVGVYALCDLDDVPIYVGQSTDGIRSRVRRHLTSARSDVIANRQVDVWEIAFVWAWPVENIDEIPNLECWLFNEFDANQKLMNGKSLLKSKRPSIVPPRQRIQVIEENERQDRLAPDQRLPRQIMQYNTLVDYILNVKNAPHLKRSLDAHFERLVRYHGKFL